MASKIKRGATVVLFATGIVAGAAGVAAAQIEYVGGGTWSHGIADGTVWSDYYHSDVCHGSTAVGSYTDRDSAPAGYWSQADAPSTIWTDETYYRTSCP